MKKLVLVAILAMVVMAVSFGGVFAETDVIGDDNTNNMLFDLSAAIAADVNGNIVYNAPSQTANVEGTDVEVNQKMQSNVTACAKGVAAVAPVAANEDGGATIIGDGNEENVLAEGNLNAALNINVNAVANMPEQNAEIKGEGVVVNQDMESNVNLCATGVATVGDVCVDLEDCCAYEEVCEEVCVEECEVKTTVPETSDVASLASVVALVVSGLGATVVGRKVK